MCSSKGLIVLCFIGYVYGHGRMIEPPARSSMWRMGFSTPKNYNDNQLNCGGFMVRRGGGRNAPLSGLFGQKCAK